MIPTINANAFDRVPVGARPHGFYPEIDNSLAGLYQVNSRVLLVAPMLSSGTADANVPVLLAGNGDAAVDLCGRGSAGAAMARAYRDNDDTGELWLLPVEDPGAGTAADGDFTVSGPATAAGVLYVYVGDGSRRRIVQPLQVGVASGDTDAEIAAAIVAAINADLDLPVTAANTDEVITITCRHKGTLGNDIAVRFNHRGALQGEPWPAGVSIAVPTGGRLTSGAGAPDMSAAIAGIADQAFDHIILPVSDDTSLDAWEAELDDRWGPLRQLYGQIWTARHGTVSELATAGVARNSPWSSVFGKSPDELAPAFKTAARYGAIAARALHNHPARPLQTLRLIGEEAASEAALPTWADKNSLLYKGISTSDRGPAAALQIDRAVTTYQKNASGVEDASYLDVTTPATLSYILRQLKAVIVAEFLERRAILVDDDRHVSAGLPIASPRIVKARLIQHYLKLVEAGVAENPEAFEKLLIVSRDGDDPTRLNVSYPPDLANPLIVFAVKVSFSLQWPRDLAR